MFAQCIRHAVRSNSCLIYATDTDLDRPSSTVSKCTDRVAFNLLTDFEQHVYFLWASLSNG